MQVTLVIPWLLPEEQKGLYPKDKQFKDAEEQVQLALSTSVVPATISKGRLPRTVTELHGLPHVHCSPSAQMPHT